MRSLIAVIQTRPFTQLAPTLDTVFSPSQILIQRVWNQFDANLKPSAVGAISMVTDVYKILSLKS